MSRLLTADLKPAARRKKKARLNFRARARRASGFFIKEPRPPMGFALRIGRGASSITSLESYLWSECGMGAKVARMAKGHCLAYLRWIARGHGNHASAALGVGKIAQGMLNLVQCPELDVTQVARGLGYSNALLLLSMAKHPKGATIKIVNQPNGALPVIESASHPDLAVHRIGRDHDLAATGNAAGNLLAISQPLCWSEKPCRRPCCRPGWFPGTD